MQKSYTIKLDKTLYDWVQDYADKHDLTISQVFRHAVRAHTKFKNEPEPVKPEPAKPKAKPMSDIEWIQAETMKRKPIEITDEDLQRVREVWGD